MIALLNKAALEKAFDKLVLIAPAKLLDEIKGELTNKVRQRIIAEMPKNLTHYSEADLTVHLQELG